MGLLHVCLSVFVVRHPRFSRKGRLWIFSGGGKEISRKHVFETCGDSSDLHGQLEVIAGVSFELILSFNCGITPRHYEEQGFYSRSSLCRRTDIGRFPKTPNPKP